MRETRDGRVYDEYGRLVKKKGFFGRFSQTPSNEEDNTVTYSTDSKDSNLGKTKRERDEFNNMQEEISQKYDELENNSNKNSKKTNEDDMEKFVMDILGVFNPNTPTTMPTDKVDEDLRKDMESARSEIESSVNEVDREIKKNNTYSDSKRVIWIVRILLLIFVLVHLYFNFM